MTEKAQRLQELQADPNRTTEEETELQKLNEEALRGVREERIRQLEEEKKNLEEQREAGERLSKAEKVTPSQSGGQTDTTTQPEGEGQRKERERNEAEEAKAEKAKAEKK